jgi:hypothetical protein
MPVNLHTFEHPERAALMKDQTNAGGFRVFRRSAYAFLPNSHSSFATIKLNSLVSFISLPGPHSYRVTLRVPRSRRRPPQKCDWGLGSDLQGRSDQGPANTRPAPLLRQPARLVRRAVDDLCDRFELEQLSRRRASTQADYRSMLRVHRQ